jgi:ribose 5-phosphate isomerase B
MGAYSTASCHYPEFAEAVCKKVQGELDSSFGILICGTGIGMSMCANKHNGIRAALCSDTYSARMTRAHNDANLLCLGARVIGSCLATDIVDAFLSADFEGGRHAVRVDMIKEIEKKN